MTFGILTARHTVREEIVSAGKFIFLKSILSRLFLPGENNLYPKKSFRSCQINQKFVHTIFSSPRPHKTLIRIWLFFIKTSLCGHQCKCEESKRFDLFFHLLTIFLSLLHLHCLALLWQYGVTVLWCMAMVYGVAWQWWSDGERGVTGILIWSI